MPFQNKNRLAVRAVFLALTIIIGFIERMIPFEFAVPGVRLGLGNAIVLMCLYLLSVRDVFVLVILKCVLNAFLFGSANTFLFSFAGGMLSFFIMTFMIKIFKQKISPVGVSVAGAVMHNAGQMIVAALLIGSAQIIYYLPILLVSGVITGVITGMAARFSLRVINR